jgi:hypothetical protein
MGILIAFGIDAAWDERQDGEREATYLSALSAELSENEQIFEGYLGKLESELAGDGEAIQTLVFANRSVTSAEILDWTTRSQASFIRLPERAALDDILSSGGIAFVDDPETRRLISKYAQRLERQLLAQEDLVSHWSDRMSKYFEVHASMYDMVGVVDWYPQDSLLPTREGSFDFDVEAFVGSREFANLLVHRSIRIMTARTTTNELLGVLRELGDRLEGAV